MSTPTRALKAIEALAVSAVALVIVTVLLVVTLGNSESIQCSEFPQCLANPGTLIGALHTYLAGVVLLLLLILTFVAVTVRRTAPGLALPSALALLMLVVAAAFGALFAVGTVPVSWAPIQFLWLGLVVLLLLVVELRVRRHRTRAPT